MADYNHTTLVGRLINEPEIKDLGNERARAGFTLAVNRPYKDSNGKKTTDFFNIVAWGKLAELVKEYVKKSDTLLVDGRIQSRSYEQGEEKKWITEIVAESFSFLNNKKAEKKAA